MRLAATRDLWAGCCGISPLMLAVTLATIALSVYLYIIIPKGFFPAAGRRAALTGSISPIRPLRFQAMRDRVVQLAEDRHGGSGGRQPECVRRRRRMGGGGAPSTTARMNITAEAAGGAQGQCGQVIARLRPKAVARSRAPACICRPCRICASAAGSSGAQYQYTLQSDSVRELNEWAPQVYRKLRTLPQLADVNSDQQDRGLQARLQIDRATAARMGISAQMIDDTLYDAFGQRQVSVMYTQLNQYHVVMEVEPRVLAESRRPEVSSTSAAAIGQQVPLSAFTRYASEQHRAVGESSGAISVRDDFVQSAGGHCR